MQPTTHAGAVCEPDQVVAAIEQKAMRLSALLRDIDNHPMPLRPEVRDQLDEVLEMLGVRIRATRALLHQPVAATSGT
ncbi:MAG: hypothetical protein ABR541_02755 [Candidatus Dormibacteria bacterium]